MKAIILAAGRGSRMGNLTHEAPKCMVEFAGRRLIDWQLDALKKAGIQEIGIVTGYKADEWTVPDVTYFTNAHWESTNMVASLRMAEPWLEQDRCIVSYSDIVYSAKAIEALIKNPAPIAIAYDPEWLKLWSLRFAEPLADAETFRLDAAGRLIEIGRRAQSVAEIQGQYMGLLSFQPQGWQQVNDILRQNEAASHKMDMTTLLNHLLKAGVPIGVSAINDRWFEVDSARDLHCYTEQWEKAGRGDIFNNWTL